MKYRINGRFVTKEEYERIEGEMSSLKGSVLLVFLGALLVIGVLGLLIGEAYASPKFEIPFSTEFHLTHSS